jgi:hypothetical protein
VSFGNVHLNPHRPDTGYERQKVGLNLPETVLHAILGNDRRPSRGA